MRMARRHIWFMFLVTVSMIGSVVWVSAAQVADDEGWVVLFDGTSFDNWVMGGPGHFSLEDDGTMRSHGGMGIFQYAGQTFRDFELEMEWKVENFNDNSGVFVRFPEITSGTGHSASAGYEIQIDNSDSGIPNRTGSIYDIQASTKVSTVPLGEWNHYRIQVVGQRYKVWLNGELILDWMGSRGREGYIGIQNHHAGAQNAFRNIRARNLPIDDAAAPLTLGEAVAVYDERETIRVLVFTGQYGPEVATANRLTQVLSEVEPYTEFEFTMTANAADLNATTLAGHDVLLFGNTSGNIPLDDAQRQAILDFVAAGGGFAGTYSAAVTNNNWPEYRELLGGAMILEEAFPQGVQWGVDLVVEESDNPAVAALAQGHSAVENRFSIRDGIYRFDADPRPNVRVLYSLVTESVGKYELSPALAAQPVVIDPPPGDYPLAWCRAYQDGTVFYTSLGSSQHVWGYVFFVEHLLHGLRLAAGATDGDCTVDPVAVASSEPWSGQAPLTVHFSSAGSHDPNGTDVAVHWDFGDGKTSDDPNPTHTYNEVGDYRAVLTVTDGYGRSSEHSIRLVVGNTAPEPSIQQPAHGALLPSSGSMLPLSGSAVDMEDGALGSGQLRWVVTAERKVGGQIESEVIATLDGATGEVEVVGSGGWDEAVKLHVELTATDSEGLANTVNHVVRYSRLQAEGADRLAGFTIGPIQDHAGSLQVTAGSVGDYLMWKDINLTNQAIAFLRVAPGHHGALIHLRIGGPDGETLATVPVPGNPAEPDAFSEVPLQFSPLEGIHDLYLVTDIGNPDVRIDWLQIIGGGTW